MLTTKKRIEKRFDGKLGPVGVFFFSTPEGAQEPTAATQHSIPRPIGEWLRTIATARATGQKMLVGKFNGLWVEIEGNGEMLETYTIRQLPDGKPPQFYSETTQQKNHYSADVHACTLRKQLQALFIFDPRA